MSDLYKQISLKLKSLRKDRGWSLDKASEKTGVSKAMLGQIEREESSPTIATLWKIATGFDTSFSSLIADVTTPAAEPIFGSSNSKELYPNDQKIHVTPIFAYDKMLHCEIFAVELLPGAEHISPAHQPGVVEHVIVVEGAIEVLVNDLWKPLQTGEGLRFAADQPHGYRNITKGLARFHNIIHYSRVD